MLALKGRGTRTDTLQSISAPQKSRSRRLKRRGALLEAQSKKPSRARKPRKAERTKRSTRGGGSSKRLKAMVA